MTCRTAEYQRAVADSDVLTAAAVIELEPVRADDAITLLTRSIPPGPRARGWQPVFDTMKRDPGGPVATALSGALMIVLARDVDGACSAQPTGLKGYPDRPSTERYLLGALISTRFGRDENGSGPAVQGVRRWDPEDATQWLTFLAIHLDRLGTRDLA